MSRWNSFDDVLNLHREVDRLFNQVWSDMPLRPAGNASPSFPFRVRSTDDGWTVEVPMPGIDPKDVKLEVAGQTLSIRAEGSGDDQQQAGYKFEETLTVPPFVDLEKLSASHWHGMLRLSLPLRESVKPRRIEIQTQQDDQKQITTSN